MHTRRTLLALGSGTLMPTVAQQPLQPLQSLVIAAGEIPPFASARKEDSFLGALFEQIGPLMGVHFNFVYLPWPRCEASVEAQTAWGTVPYVPTAERTQKFLFSAPLYAKRTVLFYFSPPGRPAVPGRGELASLRGLRIGGVRGYFYAQLLLDAGIHMDEALSEEQNFRKLHAGRVDLVAAIDAVGWAVIRRQFAAQDLPHFHTLDTPLHVGFNYLMTSQRYPGTEALLGQFNAALATLRRQGGYQAVADRFGLAGA
jgi:polar amino acid transport system substrate-binding protein